MRNGPPRVGESLVVAATLERTRPRFPPVLVAIAVLLPLVRFLVVVLRSDEQLQLRFTDDAYYYALIAENIVDGKGSTFGGIVSTNGYQPLWQGVYTAVALFARGDALLRVMYGIEAMLFASTVVLAFLLLRRYDVRTAATWGILYAVVVGLSTGDFFFDGMEIAVVVPLALVGLLLLQRGVVGGFSPRLGAALGVAALLLAAARLDAVALPVVCWTALLIRSRSRSTVRALGVAAAIVVAGFVAYLGWNQVVFGTPVPVSGQAKALGGGQDNLSLVMNYLTYGWLGKVPLLLGAQVVAASATAYWVLRRARRTGKPLLTDDGDRFVATLLVVGLVAQLLQIIYYTVTTTWFFGEWYYYYIPIQLTLAVTVVVQAVLQAMPAPSRSSSDKVTAAVGGVAAAVCSLVVLVPANHSWEAAVPAAARWVTAETAPNAVFAIGDRAGYFTWLTRRPTLQLEGLVEDKAYLRVIAGQRIVEEMARRGAAYYVRSADLSRHPTPNQDAGGCESFPEPAHGGGPKSTVRVCASDLVYSATDVSGRYTWQIWRLPGDNSVDSSR